MLLKNTVSKLTIYFFATFFECINLNKMPLNESNTTTAINLNKFFGTLPRN